MTIKNMASCTLCTVTAHFYFWQVFLLLIAAGSQNPASLTLKPCITHRVFGIWLSLQWKVLQRFSMVWSVAGSENIHILWHRNIITSHTIVTSVRFDPTTLCTQSHHTNQSPNFHFSAKIKNVPFGASLSTVSLTGCPGGYRLCTRQSCRDWSHDKRNSWANGRGLNVGLMNINSRIYKLVQELNWNEGSEHWNAKNEILTLLAIAKRNWLSQGHKRYVCVCVCVASVGSNWSQD